MKLCDVSGYPWKAAWAGQILAIGLAFLHGGAPARPQQTRDWLKWSKLPAIPDNEGFAGSFAGVLGGQLLVAGGANFVETPERRKVWYDPVFVLDEAAGKWRQPGKLPRALGYGVSITLPEGLICAGGSDATQHHSGVFQITLINTGAATPSHQAGQLLFLPFPPLPQACANMSGALLGRTIYVAGGMTKPDATEALHTFWALHLDEMEQGWQVLEPWPGQGRIFAAAGVVDGSFFLAGGAALKAGTDGKAERIWLKDGFRYTPGRGWKRIADLPQVSVAAPSPMPALGGSTLLLMGGDDGAQISVPPAQHRGFPRKVFAYHPATETWQTVSEIPLGLVTTSTICHGSRIVVPGGEKMPGKRSTEVWSAEIIQPVPSVRGNPDILDRLKVRKEN